MNYSQALELTRSLKRLGNTPGLACLVRVLEGLGNPQNNLKAVHVAGTNGKGSVCVMTASMLQTAGYKVGLYTSPYLVDFRERFLCNGQMMEKETYARLCQQVYEVMKAQGEELSQFAFITAIAFCWYKELDCDVVVLETGLGGRLDATNVIENPLVTAITSVSLDHTELLGDRVEQVMAEKCGIMKPGGITVVAPNQSIEALAVAMECAAKTGNRLVVPATGALEQLENNRFRYGDKEYELGLIGSYQPQNASVALEIVAALAEKGLPVSDKAMRQGLANVCHPGRCQVLRQNPLILLDGAHNPGGAEALAQTVKELLQGQKAVGVCGVMHDKAAHELVNAMYPYLEQLIAVTPNNVRALPADRLAELFAPYCKVSTAAMNAQLIETIKCQTQPVLIFGSLYLAGELLTLW